MNQQEQRTPDEIFEQFKQNQIEKKYHYCSH